jgi:hypothetical protein
VVAPELLGRGSQEGLIGEAKSCAQTRPEGKLTLTMSGNREIRDEVLHYLRAAQPA